MGKVLIWSDLHLHPHRKSWERFQDCLDVMEWVFATAQKRGIKEIIFCGDLFHDRTKIDILVYHRAFEVLQKYLSDHRMTMYCVVGNHDMWYYDRRDVTSVRPLEALPDFHLVDEPCSIPIHGKLFDFLPYTHDPVEMLKRLPASHKGRVLCAHIAVDGAQLNTMHNTRAEVSVEHDGDMVRVGVDLFRDWDHVFLGHYHGEQKLADNIEYIGSPLQLSFGEAFQFKHVVVYDTETGEREYIRNTFSPQHFVIPQKDVHKYELDNNFIRVEVDDLAATNIVDLRNEIMKTSRPGLLEIKAAEKKEDRNHVVEDAKAILLSQGQMVERYVDEVGTDGLDKDKLLEVGKLVCVPLSQEELEALA